MFLLPDALQLDLSWRPRCWAAFDRAHVTAPEEGPLRTALAEGVGALMEGGLRARLPHARVTAERLAELR